MSCSLKACAPCKLNTCSLCREARYAAFNNLFCERGPDSLNGGGQDAEPGGGKGGGVEALLCSSRASVEGAQLGDGSPAPTAASAQGSCVCLLHQALLPLLLCAEPLAALCSVSGEQFSRCLSEVWILSAQNVSWLSLRPRQ